MMKGLVPTIRAALTYLAVLIILLFFGFPIFWTVLTSIKPQALIPQSPPVWLFEPTLDHFRAVLTGGPLISSLANSFMVAGASTLLALLVGAPAAYAFSRFRFRGKEQLAFYFLSARMAPPIAMILPFFLVARTLGLLDTRLILILAYMTFNFGFVIWLLRGFFAEVPIEMDEAAQVDGCTRIGAFLRVVLPLTAPGIAAAAIICFIFSWNEFLFALILTSHNTPMITVTMAQFVTELGTEWNLMSATAVMAMGPALLVTIFGQKYVVRGLRV